MPAAMRIKLCLFVLVALVAPFSLPQTASAAKTARILVHFDKHTSAAKQKALIGRIGGRKVATVRRLGTAVVRVPAAGKKEALSLLRRQSGVPGRVFAHYRRLECCRGSRR